MRRASRNTCWPSTTSMPSACSAHRTGISMTSTPSGSPAGRARAAPRRSCGPPPRRSPASGWNAPRSVEMPPAPVLAAPPLARRRVVEPGVVQLVVPGRRAEVPEDRLAAAGQQREADQLVHRPRADVGGRHVADVGEVEARAARRARSARARPCRRASRSRAQPVEVDALLPVDRVGAKRADCHRSPASRCAGTSSKPSAPERCQVLLHMTYARTSLTSFLRLTRARQVYSPTARQRPVRGPR